MIHLCNISPRHHHHVRPALTALLVALAPVTAQAQNEPDPAQSVFNRDHIRIGAGVAISPSYDGSDDYVVSPLPLVQGRLGGINITPRPAGLALDLIDDPTDAKISFQAGPVARVRFDRNRQIEDDVVQRLGERDVAVELGGNAGISLNGITNPYDSLTISIDVRGDVAGAHGGIVAAPSISFQTPLSRGTFLSLTISGEHVDDDYADYYFSITPAASTASGLPVFAARGGWKTLGAGLFAGVDFNGDITDGGFAMFAGAGYARMLGDFKAAPTTSISGSADQFLGTIGLGYTF